jgi:hypothetical protein
MKRYYFILTILIFGLLFKTNISKSREFAVTSNFLQYLNLGTLNAEASISVSRHWSFITGALYNPFYFKFNSGEKEVNNRQRTFNIGTRFWPWHVYSGWWICGKTQYQEYNFGGVYNKSTREGDRFGAGISAGYSYMLGKHFNLEFGAGLWSGLDIYRVYSCPRCGITLKNGRKWFVLPDNITLALSYIF